MSENNKPIKLVGFLCNWCSYAGADLAGVSRFQYDTNIRIIRIPCSGRADPLLALKALQEGADGVLVSGCHPGDCHYSDGNYHARRRFAVIHDLMAFMGMDTRRLQVSWVSASEGKKWADVVNAVAAEVKAARDEAQKVVEIDPAWLKDEHIVKPLAENKKLTDELQKTAKELLTSGKAKAVIGHAKRPRGREGTKVAIVTSADDVKELTAYDGCVPNLSRYLKPTIKKYGTTAMAGKGADMMTAVNLIREHQIDKQDVHLIAFGCPGLKDDKGNLHGRCVACILGALNASNNLIGEKPSDPGEDDYADIAMLDALPREARAAYWNDVFETCIRCNACRNSCPSCFCSVCFAECRQPTWVFPSSSLEGNKFFHLVRAYHLAGRCSNCGECERVCPMGIPLLRLARKASQIVKKRFGYTPAADPDVKNPLSVFKIDEQVEFIR